MLPLATTTVTFQRVTAGDDPYEDAALATVAAGVPAHISTPSGSEARTGGQQETVDAVLDCEPVDGVDHYCTVIDDNTDETWSISWLRIRRGLGLDHLEAGLRAVGGGSNG